MPVTPLEVTVPGLKRKQGAAGILSDRFPKAACTLVRRKSVRGRKSESPSQWFEVRRYNTVLRARGYRLFTSSGRISDPTCSYRPSVGGSLYLLSLSMICSPHDSRTQQAVQVPLDVAGW